MGAGSFLQSTNVSHNFPRRNFAPAAAPVHACRILNYYLEPERFDACNVIFCFLGLIMNFKNTKFLNLR